ncbi:MAG: EscU/YscU/HrcU family type III secretion system export apparatus switch protein [Rhodoferax sp.]|nr:EscU/YscU/HrcU family type III secretion system export apparatus switch protein [Rhodoferax sp.]
MESNSQDRNLPATERKLRKAVEDGQVTRSQYLSHLAVLGVGAVAVVAFAPLMLDRLQLHMARQLSFDAAAVREPQDMLSRLQDMSLSSLMGCVLFASIVMTAVVLSNISVGGWVRSTKPIMPDLSRINPLKGFGRMFTKDKLTEVGKMLAIVIVLATIGIVYLARTIQPVASLVMQPSVAALQYMGDWLTTGMGFMLMLMLVVAAIDVPLQKFLHKSRLKMSHQEFKQEHKESDGNPHVKGRLRQRQRELSQSGSVAAVPKADFVVMNPTHYAVAIRYDDKTMSAPQVISKGADLLAMRIRDLARSHSIPVLQSPMLARALYANAEIGQDIPTTLYTAVAQVLAYVYRLKAALRGEAPMPGDPPEPEVPAELDPLRRTTAAAARP